MHFIHHDIAYNWCFSFSEKGQSKDDYYQLSQFQIRFLYLARAYLWVIDYGLTPVTSQEIIYITTWGIRMSKVFNNSFITCWKIRSRYAPDTVVILSPFLKFRINTCNKPGKYLWTIDCGLTPVTSQEIIYMKRLKINACNKPGNHLSFSGQRSIPVTSQENICERPIMD